MRAWLPSPSTPGDLLALARAELRAYGVAVIEDTMVEIEAGFTLRLVSGSRIDARRILLATGAVDRLRDIPGARGRWGRDFLHCPYCHGWEVRDQPIGVVGTDAGSVDHAHLLRQWSDDVVFFAHSHVVTADERRALDARGIVVVDGLVVGLSVVGDRLHAVELDDGRLVPRAAVFVRPSLQARPDDLARALGVDVDDDGLALVDALGRSSVPGVWVAGNAANARAQVITAAGEGSAAAIDINADLVREDIRDALAAASAAAMLGA